MMRPCATTWSSSGPGSAAASPRCGWPRRATRSACWRRGGASPTTTFPRRPGDARRFLWAPRLGCYGIQRITLLRGQGRWRDRALRRRRRRRLAGLRQHALRAARRVLRRPAVGRHHRLARRAGAATTTRPSGCSASPRTRSTRRADEVDARGRRARWGWRTPSTRRRSACSSARPGRAAWPTRTSAAPGPDRTGCIHCGECMTGCRHDAKNTLVKNYLYLAERHGAQVHPLTTVTARRARDPAGGYDGAHRRRTGAGRASGARCFTAEQVVFAAGALGTQRLLHRMRDEGACRALSARLGELTRTNSESILGARSRRRPAARRLHPGRGDHLVVPPRRAHPHRAGPLRQGQQRDGRCCRRARPTAVRRPAPRRWLGRSCAQPAHVARTCRPAALVRAHRHRAGHADRSTTRSPCRTKPRAGWCSAARATASPTRPGSRSANEAVRRIAEEIDGTPGGAVGEPFNIPMTAHFIGGCAIGDTPDDRRHRRLPAGVRPPRAARRRRRRRSRPTSASTRR